MSIDKSKFILKHEDLMLKLKTQYSTSYGYFGSELSLINLSKFPAIGIFLGVSSSQDGIRAYKPIKYSYFLGAFDKISLDRHEDALTKQGSMFSLIENIIKTMEYKVEGEIEPITDVAINEGSFISGWLVPIEFNA